MAVRHLLTAAALSLTLCAVPSMAFAEAPNGPPQQPNLENITNANEANRLVDQYNDEVDSYNQQLENEYNKQINEINQYNEEVKNYNTQADLDYNNQIAEINQHNEEVDNHNSQLKDEYNKQVEEIDQYNKEVDNYNTQVDLNYEQAVQETEKKNEEIEAHNAAEQQRVADENAANEKAQADADARNAEIDKENAAEQERINQVNEERQQQYEKDKVQYDADLMQYEKDLAMEKRIKDAGYDSVEQYNNMIVTRYNNPANASVEKNANTTEISIDDTYIVTEGTEKSGRLIPVHIEHNFSEVGLSYVKDFYIDAKDSIMLLSVGALVETTQPGYACFYYKTDNTHSMGYWISAGSTLYFYPSAYVEDGWNCGDSHFLTYKDSTNEYVWPNEDIYIVYDYMWQSLKVYKTYNTPTEPTEPTLELETYIPIEYEYVEPIDVIPADIWEAIPEPIKDEYLTYKGYPDYPEYLGYEGYPERSGYLIYKDYPEYPELLGYMDYIDIIENQIEQDQNQEPINQQIDLIPERDSVQPVINENTIPVTNEDITPDVPVTSEDTVPYIPIINEDTAPSAPVANEDAVPDAPITNEDAVPYIAPVVFNETVIEDEAVPLTRGIGISPEYAYADTIEDEEIPMAAGEVEKNWALVNLILMIISILVLVKLPRKNDEEKDYEYKHHNNIIGVVLAIATAVMFILTENVWLPMTLVDSWTIWMAIICGGAIVARFFSRTTKEEIKEEE